MLPIRIEQGDCLDVMRRLKDEGVQVDSVVTDPPYHLASIVKRFGKAGSAPARSEGATGVYKRASVGFMGQEWDGGDIAFQPATWALALDLLKPGGHLVAFAAPKNFHRLACAIEDAGFEIRDNILRMVAADERIELFMNSLTDEQCEAFLALCVEQDIPDFLAWIFGTGFPKGSDAAEGCARTVVASGEGDTDSWCAAVEPWEGWNIALKPAFEPVILARKPLIGTVAENLLAHGTGAINIDGCRVGETGARNNGRRVDSDIYGKLGPMERVDYGKGRFPANVIHDGSSDEVLAAFPAAPGQQGRSSDSSRSQKNTYGAVTDNGKTYTPRGDSGSAARFFYSAKAGKSDRCESKHPTVKPIALMRYLVRLITPPGGTVLDPFAGSGTTGQAAIEEDCEAILIEREDAYVQDIERRMARTGEAMIQRLISG